ncbi:hypothetical protein [Streptomyces sp. B1I3]|uniref:hypothetical protein n=1 Tax=Streptomyces sp. B1I3 TaxID=3042264 RepID=UPI0027806864|nr:hypothetical protein [Streptomyces sp. B1I3]MDQ0795567.1 hypothetical protein [Streptomyces sp. B1I3]
MTFAPKTWVVGEVVSAAILNQEIRDQLNSIFGAWSSYTPTWQATTTQPVLGNGTLVGRYLKVGRTVTFTAQLTIGSTTTLGSGNQALGLPVLTATVSNGSPGVLDISVSRGGTPNFVMGRIPLSSATQATGTIWLPSTVTIGDWDAWTHNAPYTLAAGDTVRLYGTYQSAT